MSHLHLVPPYVEPAAPPPWQLVLVWLAEICGSEEAVADLDAAVLVDVDDHDRAALPEHLAPTVTLLDDLAERWFDDEVAVAMRRALRYLWEDGVAQAVRATHPEALAGGIAWAVGKGNECFRPVGTLGVTRVAEAVGVGGSLSTHGQRVRAALVDPDRPHRSDRGVESHRPAGVPHLLPLGDVDLLVSSVRTTLVGLRDRAWRAQENAGGGFYRGR